MTTCLLALLLAPALADKNEAETCLRTKIWDGYNQGWAVRTAVSSDLVADEHKTYQVTLYAGNEYRFQACADPSAADIDLVLHDAKGTELLRDTTDDREPSFSFKPDKTGTFFVVVHASALQRAATRTAASMAVTYR